MLGATFDLLGGRDQADSAVGVLIVLFFLNPVATAFLVVIETLTALEKRKNESPSHSFVMLGLAVFLLFQAITTNVVILMQVKLH
ncbi:MAG: hypothetical protein HKM93_17275 [Desulfobacteraceae bacterium]|nr:hypothetical protein [Desulfobacteraceae bacterium]